MSGQVVNWAIACTTPTFPARKTSGPFSLFSGFSLFATLIHFVFLLKTRGATLEEVGQAFEEAFWRAAFSRLRERSTSRGTYALRTTG